MRTLIDRHETLLKQTMPCGKWLRKLLLFGHHIETAARDPPVFRLRPVQIILHHFQPVKLICLKKFIFAQIVNNSLLLRDRLELEAFFGGLEWLGSPENKRVISHGLQRR